MKVHSLTDHTFESVLSGSSQPWLISYCNSYGGGDCLDSTACLKVAAILVSVKNTPDVFMIYEYLRVHTCIFIDLFSFVSVLLL